MDWRARLFAVALICFVAVFLFLLVGFCRERSGQVSNSELEFKWTIGRPSTLEGVVLRQDSTPAAGVYITAYEESGPCTTRTDAFGRFSMLIPEPTITGIAVEEIGSYRWRFGLPVGRGVSCTIREK